MLSWRLKCLRFLHSVFVSPDLELHVLQMAEQDNELFAIEVDADDYAETAAGDTPPVSRTFQSEADFQAQKATYSAKIDGGKTYEDLVAAVPVLDASFCESVVNDYSKTRLSKKDIQLLGYAIGELYYDKDYQRLLELCERISHCCEVDEKTTQSLSRWMQKCYDRLS